MRGYSDYLKSLPFSLRGQLLFLVCLASLPALLFMFFAAENERTAAFERIQRESIQLAVMTSREHTHQIRGARALLSWLGEKVTREGLQSPVFKDSDFLRALLAGHPQLANIGVLTADGQVISSAYPLSNYRSWKDNPAYLAALGSKTVEAGSYITSPIFKRPTLNHAYAVRNSENQAIAVLFDGLNLDWFAEMTRYARLSKGVSLFIADGEGNVLVSSQTQSTNSDETFSGQAHFPEMSVLVKSERGAVLGLDSTDARHYVVAAPLEEAPGLYMVAAVPYDQVVGQANTIFYRTLLSLGLLVLFTAIMVFVTMELGMLRGIRSLTSAAKRLGAGDFSARAKIPRGRNEFASLANTFNAMADTLVERHNEAIEVQQRLRALANRIQEAREEEAARISRELHDEMAQSLTAMKIDLSQLQACCPANRFDEPCALALKQTVTDMTGCIGAMVDLVRRISSELRPGVLDKLGLTEALQWLASEITARTDLAIQVEADDSYTFVDKKVSLTLFRIAQEALTNVIRHAEAQIVEIRLITMCEKIVLTVCDDGKGIPSRVPDGEKSFGIIGMRERAMLLGGHLSICGDQKQGTTVTATVPVFP